MPSEQRIRHVSTAGRTPTRDEARASRLFSPIAVGPLTLAERTWVPAMVPWRATAEGFVTEDVLAWYARFARGRPGAIVVEATGIRDIPSGPLLRIGHDRFLPGLRDLVETVRRESGGATKLFIQLIDFLAIRRRPERGRFLGQFLSITDELRIALGAPEASESELRGRLMAMPPSDLRKVLSPRECEALDFGSRERVTDTHLPHIADLPHKLPGLFADAALRARQAGFDGVELHYAHAYTMASFLSATNTRVDGYGGSREHRVRLPIEVYEEVRRRVGTDYVVGCRFLAEECIDGGSELGDAAYFGVEFARAGMDFLSTSRGGKFDDAKQPKVGDAAYPYTGLSGSECMPTWLSDEAGPFGRNMAPTKAIRDAVRAAKLATPIICAGGIHNFEMAERALADGVCDIAGAARQSLADPDWFRKTALGLGDTVRRCEYTNYCEGLDQKHKPVTCKLWDRLELDEPATRLSSDGRRRLVAPEWQPPGRFTE
jgi:2,4-dienoyl-CoA reductase-like NADH-dependent reductase (Old Yellow Enzyme family)